ncbi:MAG: PIN domain-containing protein [Lachnospiraceae bacterium]|nr:PIN domain-containing protein [Lachnospiraceae bacterium]
MKLMLDANILLDVLQGRQPHLRFSSLIWKICECGQAAGYVSSLSFANLVYIMRKELDPEDIEDVYRKLSLLFRWADLTQNDLSRAAALRWHDFEDALQAVMARRLGADYIITRNVSDYEGSPVPAISPEELLKSFL